MPVFPSAYKLICTYLLFVLLPIIPFAAKAEDSLSMTESIVLATQNQPLLQSLDDAAAAARQAAIAEGQLPDPKVKFGMINLPVTTRDALRYNRDDQTMANIGLSQEIIPLRKREIASNRLSAEAEQFQTEQQVIARTIQRDVALAWLDAYEAQRKSELFQRLISDMKAERQTLASTVSSGGAKSTDVLQIDTDISMTNEKLIFTQRDERKARANLSRWIGHAASRSIASELPFTANNSTLVETKIQLERHPELKNAFQNEKLAQLDVDAAQANFQRNWGWEVGYGKRFNDRSDMLSVQISIDLQLNRANRQDRRATEKLLLVEKAHKDTEDKRRALQFELQTVEADADAALAREREHLTNLIPNAHAKLKLAQSGYSAGASPLSEIWQARRDLIDIEMDHWSILTDYQRAVVKIGYLLNDSRLFKQFEKE